MKGEHDCYWGILLQHLALADPPVHSWGLDEFVKGGAWHPPTPWSTTTTGFALNHLINYLNAPAGRRQTWVSRDEAAQITDDLAAAMATHSTIDSAVLFEDIDTIVGIRPSRYLSPDDARPFEITIHLGDRWSFTLPPSVKTLVVRGGAIDGYFWQLRDEWEHGNR